jgi:NCAIR mutase (PurE)-related protein
MHPQRLRRLLEDLLERRTDVETAMQRLRSLPFEDLGFARVDQHRALRCGFPEVVFGQGKPARQFVEIFARVAAHGANVLATRVRPKAAAAACARFPAAQYDRLSRTLTLRQRAPQPGGGFVGIVCAGTSDLPVAEEARITAEIMDQPTRTFYDVGVAGLHRLLDHSQALQQANVLVVVAGMEGALPSVVGGLVACPVIAVPTSVGYGASFGGLAALLAMLNSCAAGVSVVNIDNGFGAGYQAAMINRLISTARAEAGSAPAGAETVQAHE